MSHYHEVYFNTGTSDGPRVGATRRHRATIIRERAADLEAGRYMWSGAGIVRCDRPDEQCPWTSGGALPDDERVTTTA